MFFIPVLSGLRCAQVGQLNGGQRDKTPPVPLAATPASKSTHFSSEVITLKFDENIKLNDLPNQLVISPRLKTMPEVESDRKTVRITLKKEELRPNTTYRFSFGKAIADMNEGNVLQDFEYVLSTGDVIDSLGFRGVAIDAFTNKPAGGMLIGLYREGALSDSLPYKETPEYTSKSSDNGEFRFHNLPNGTFKAYAFDDKNKNQMYDGETEKIGFLDTDPSTASDSLIKFRLFQEEASRSFIKKTVLPFPGLAQIILNKKGITQVAPLKPADSSAIFETKAGTEKDTILVYYKNVLTDTLALVLRSQTKTDTLTIALSKKNTAQRRRIKNYSSNASAGSLALNTPLVISFSNWMNILQTNMAGLKLSSKQDSLVELDAVTGRWLDVNRFQITNPLKEGVEYTLKIDTCAFFDVNEVCNDSLRIRFKTESRLEFGKVTLNVLLNKKQAYVIQLINDKSEVVRESHISFSLSSSNATSIEFADVKPAVYLVKIIYDDNNNRKWDTGNLLLKKQPERVIINSKQIKVLSDWEIEEEIQVKE